MSHLTTSAFGMESDGESLQHDALLYVSSISKKPGQICHFQLREPYAVSAPNVLWYVFLEFPFCITAVSAKALTIRKYSKHTDVLCKITMPIH